MESQLESIGDSFAFRYSEHVREALDGLPDCFTITDPCVCGHPIVFASRGFLKMVRYSMDEVIGKNGRMFQGPDTERRAVMEIREAIKDEKGVEISLLNYRKDGKAFWMFFKMCPVFSKDDGRVINFVSVQVPILRKGRWRKNGNSFRDHTGFSESLFKCCRREVCQSSIVEQGCSFPFESVSEIQTTGPCEASEEEKTKASAAISNILSILTRYSEYTGRLVCRKRCCAATNKQLPAALNISLGRIKQSFVLTDALLPSMPILYASEPFLRLTGYARSEVLGRNCSFLSGVGTDRTTQYQIKESIQAQQACTVRILNYRKDGTSFWNFLHISPINDASGKVAFFVGVQVEDCGSPGSEEALTPAAGQLHVVAAVKVAVRAWSMKFSTSAFSS